MEREGGYPLHTLDDIRTKVADADLVVIKKQVFFSFIVHLLTYI